MNGLKSVKNVIIFRLFSKEKWSNKFDSDKLVGTSLSVGLGTNDFDKLSNIIASHFEYAGFKTSSLALSATVKHNCSPTIS